MVEFEADVIDTLTAQISDFQGHFPRSGFRSIEMIGNVPADHGPDKALLMELWIEVKLAFANLHGCIPRFARSRSSKPHCLGSILMRWRSAQMDETECLCVPSRPRLDEINQVQRHLCSVAQVGSDI